MSETNKEPLTAEEILTKSPLNRYYSNDSVHMIDAPIEDIVDLINRFSAQQTKPLQDKLDKTTEILIDAQTGWRRSNEQLEKLEHSLSQSQKEVSELKEEIEAFKTVHIDNRNHLLDILKERDEYAEKYTCNQHTVVNQQSTISELKSELTQVKEQLATEKQLVNDLKQAMIKGNELSNNLRFDDKPSEYDKLNAELTAVKEQNKELAEALDKVKNEWERQKGLFEILERDGWMDNLMDNDVSQALTNHQKQKDK